jgi:hypothetical protein
MDRLAAGANDAGGRSSLLLHAGVALCSSSVSCFCSSFPVFINLFMVYWTGQHETSHLGLDCHSDLLAASHYSQVDRGRKQIKAAFTLRKL